MLVDTIKFLSIRHRRIELQIELADAFELYHFS